MSEQVVAFRIPHIVDMETSEGTYRKEGQRWYWRDNSGWSWFTSSKRHDELDKLFEAESKRIRA